MLGALLKFLFGSVRKIVMSFMGLFLLLGLLLWWAQSRVSSFAEPYLLHELKDVPATHVGLVPGTSPLLADGRANHYFKYRIEAAAALWKAKKIRVILVSGDNRTHQYNEPKAMKQALVKLGVPAQFIVLDYAGFRTLDSVVRCRDVFGQTRVLFISQRFHCERAIYIGRHRYIDIMGYVTADPHDDELSTTGVREWFARVRTLLDVHLLETEPKFLGEKITLPR